MNAFEIIEKANYDIDHDKITLNEYLDRIKITKDVKPIIYGEWISGIDKDHQAYCYCSNCTIDAHEQDADFIKSNFCPNCGATMFKEIEEEE